MGLVDAGVSREGRVNEDLDVVLDALLAKCACGACARYRRWFVARAAVWAVRIEQSLRSR